MKAFIPACNLAALKARIAKLNKKCSKLGFDAINLIEGEVSYVRIDDTEYGKVKYINIIVNGAAPVMNGWKLVAAIDFLETGVIIRGAPGGYDVPEKYRHSNDCEHCETNRARKYIYVIVNADGEYKGVGKTCLQDFIGEDISAHIAAFSGYRSLVDALDDDGGEFYSSGGRWVPEFEVDEVLALAMHSVDIRGFVPSSEFGSTKQAVIDFYFPLRGADPSELDCDAVGADRVAELKNWVLTNESNNDFFTNLKTILAPEMVESKYFGYVCGAVAAFVKESKRKADQKSVEVTNEWVGKQKQRLTFENVTVLKKHTFDGYYGTTTIITLLDSDGHVLVWFNTGGGSSDFEVDSKVDIKGTVKNFDEYKGIKQTVLNRVTRIK